MKSLINMVPTNQQRVIAAGRECHTAISQMDIQQFRIFSKTAIGRSMLAIANEYADYCQGLRHFWPGMFDKDEQDGTGCTIVDRISKEYFVGHNDTDNEAIWTSDSVESLIFGSNESIKTKLLELAVRYPTRDLKITSDYQY